MKTKIIILVVCSLIIATAFSTQAQVSVKSPSANLKVEFRRCITNSDLAFIDILITNTSKQDTKIQCWGWIEIYDDEGNVYNNKDTSDHYKQKIYISDNSNSRPEANETITIPAGIAYRARIILLDGFDKFATEVKLLRITFNWDVFNTKTYGNWLTDSIELRNLPIVRE